METDAHIERWGERDRECGNRIGNEHQHIPANVKQSNVSAKLTIDSPRCQFISANIALQAVICSDCSAVCLVCTRRIDVRRASERSRMRSHLPIAATTTALMTRNEYANFHYIAEHCAHQISNSPIDAANDFA